MKISGTTFIHNGVAHDYCFEESIKSMLGVCDEVIVVEAGSTDETPVILSRMQSDDPRIRIVNTTWSPAPLNQPANIDWTMDLANMARKAASFPCNLYVQADEVIHEKDYEAIKMLAELGRSFYVKRYNFWLDTKHLVPHGRVCGHWICRLAPTTVPVIWGSETIDPYKAKPSEIGLYHYGFLRHMEGFRKKAEIMLPAFCGSMDPIVYRAEKDGRQVWREIWPASEDLPFDGTHPEIIKPWLKARGHDY